MKRIELITWVRGHRFHADAGQVVDLDAKIARRLVAGGAARYAPDVPHGMVSKVKYKQQPRLEID
jgi:hypothetical protein